MVLQRQTSNVIYVVIRFILLYFFFSSIIRSYFFLDRFVFVLFRFSVPLPFFALSVCRWYGSSVARLNCTERDCVCSLGLIFVRLLQRVQGYPSIKKINDGACGLDSQAYIQQRQYTHIGNARSQNDVGETVGALHCRRYDAASQRTSARHGTVHNKFRMLVPKWDLSGWGLLVRRAAHGGLLRRLDVGDTTHLTPGRVLGHLCNQSRRRVARWGRVSLHQQPVASPTGDVQPERAYVRVRGRGHLQQLQA